MTTVYDFSVDYQISSNVTLSGYFAYAQGKSVPARIYLQDKNARYSYLELNYRF